MKRYGPYSGAATPRAADADNGDKTSTTGYPSSVAAKITLPYYAVPPRTTAARSTPRQHCLRHVVSRLPYLLFVLALLLFPRTGVRAQNTFSADPAALHTALSRVYEKGNLLVALSALEWRPGLALAATRLDAGRTITLGLRLRRQYDYAAVATAARNTTDVDLYLRDERGTLVAADRERDGTPILEFRVPTTGRYLLQVHVSAAETADGHVALALLRGSGVPIRENDFRRQADRFRTVAAELTAASTGRQFSTAPGLWPVQGSLVGPDNGLTMSNLRFAGRTVTIAATAGPGRTNAELYVANDRRQIVARTGGNAPLPLLSFVPEPDRRYDLRVEAVNTDRVHLVLTGIFQ